MQNRRSERYSRDANPALAHHIVHIRHAVLQNRSYPTRNTPKSFISAAKCSNEGHMQTHRLRFLPGRRQKAKARLIILQPTETCTGELRTSYSRQQVFKSCGVTNKGNSQVRARTSKETPPHGYAPTQSLRRDESCKPKSACRSKQQTANSKQHSPLHHYARLWARSHIVCQRF